MKRFGTVLVGVALALLGLAAPSRSADPAHPSAMQAPDAIQGAASAKEFIEDAANGGLAEVELGKLAQQKASSPEVKNFGKHMVDDHSKANEQLKIVAGKKNVTLPKQMDAKHKAEHDRLAKLSGKDFDRAYMDAMVKDHQEAVAKFKAASASGDPDVQAFATKTLPTLEEHLSLAQRVYQTAPAESVEETAGTGRRRE